MSQHHMSNTFGQNPSEGFEAACNLARAEEANRQYSQHGPQAGMIAGVNSARAARAPEHMSPHNTHAQPPFANPSPAFQQQHYQAWPSGANSPAQRPPKIARTATPPITRPVSPCPAVLQLLDENPVSRIRDDDTKSLPGRRCPRWYVQFNTEELSIYRKKHRGGKKERTRRNPVTGDFYNIKKEEEGKKK
ncbi:Pyrimidine monooxygenase [Venturia nashicola]|uniref:Pyrimidine monooxygenase n=1 Tax=Venturia nashicola TaxID=86259 RepID=A0A4Z1PHZ6_9PEZI|nr:Pyrimidine monooxygenase [Venturia nashicola]TLD37428.1 Pyrimidine monooxygenase [Venturia nashicola]